MDDSAYTRQRIWTGKDSLPRELQFLQPLSANDPQTARIMVGPRQLVIAQDAANQTATASSAATVQFSANTILAGAWNTPSAAIGVLYETIRANIISEDTSGKLQITIPLTIGIAPNINVPLANYPTPIPMTFPAIANAAFEIRTLPPTMPYLPTDGPYPNGPAAIFGLVNTDGAASHTYKRTIVISFRYIFDVDYTKERVYITGTLT
jgi:hypothetical protein